MRFPFFGRKALRGSPAALEAVRTGPNLMYPLGGTNQRVRAIWVDAQASSYAHMYRTQPAVRMVVDYIARNVSQLGLKLYERESDTKRTSRGDHQAAKALRRPNPQTPGRQFIFDIVADWLVHDNAYALKFRSGDRLVLVRVPAPAVGIIGDNRYRADRYSIMRADGTAMEVAPDDIFHWRGYNPEDPRVGISKLETLRKTLAESAASQQTNVELLQNMLQAGWIKRPLEAPDWSETARERFEEAWKHRSTDVGRTPVLEEGMEFVAGDVSPKEAQMLEGRKFAVAQVAGEYGFPVGLLTGEGDLAEQHRQFLTDVLPPITGMFAEYLDLQILEAEYGEDDLYFEFNLDEKLRGDIEEKLKSMVSVVGAPFMTRNEVRALQNLPPLPGGDELIVPLNVIEGGKPSPRVMPPQDPNGPSQDGDERKQNLAHLPPLLDTK